MKKIVILLLFLIVGIYSRADNINLVQDYMQSNSIEGKFRSIDQNGMLEGVLEYSPGHLKIMYTNPYHALLLADQHKLYLHSDENDSSTYMKISNQPLGILLSNNRDKWQSYNLKEQDSKNVIQISLSDPNGVVAVNFYYDGTHISLYSIDLRGRNINRHIELYDIQKRYMSVNNFSIPTYSGK